jgi:hypothetical protein
VRVSSRGLPRRGTRAMMLYCRIIFPRRTRKFSDDACATYARAGSFLQPAASVAFGSLERFSPRKRDKYVHALRTSAATVLFAFSVNLTPISESRKERAADDSDGIGRIPLLCVEKNRP